MKNKYTYIVALISIVTAFFGRYWFLFGLLFILNILDYITYWITAKTKKNNLNNRNSALLITILYEWILVFMSFLLSVGFNEMGKILGIDIIFLHLLGWGVLGSLIINEARNILKNMVDAGCNIPKVLSKGLDIASNILEESEKINSNEK